MKLDDEIAPALPKAMRQLLPGASHTGSASMPATISGRRAHPIGETA